MKLSIRHKFALGFVIIFFTFLIGMSFFLKTEFKKASNKIISDEMNNFKQSSSDYISQSLLINKYTQNELGLSNSNALEKFGAGVVEELSKKNQGTVVIYTKQGSILKPSDIDNGQFVVKNTTSNIQGSGKDLTSASENQSKYVINHLNNKTFVNYSYPLIINGTDRGIVRISKDYSNLFKTYDNLLYKSISAMIITFISVYIFAYLWSLKIVIPITKLSRATKEISKGNFETEISISSKDEIGDLSEDFIIMRDTIKNQMEKLIQMEQQRKIFFDNATHELKTPLTTISGYAQIIGEEDFHDEVFLKRAINHIKAESDRLHKMVIELIEVSKLEVFHKEQKFTKLNLEDLCKNVCEDMKIKADKYYMGIQYNLHENMEVFGDENQLKQVFINVIDNAIKYGDSESIIKAQCLSAEDYNEISIENKGKGIPKEKLDKIFDAFYKIDNQRIEESGSCGLGLYITKSILENHKGSIQVESVENELTRVLLRFPKSGNKLAINEE